jgi:hypothetical protein
VKTKSKPMYRQGDVLIVAIDSIPADVTPVKRTKRGVVLAEGEVTGHAHRIPSRSASLYRSESDARFLRVMGPAPVKLEHEEHKTVPIPPGNYRVSIHNEYQPGELPRQVAD